jgi:hypothetical protein
MRFTFYISLPLTGHPWRAILDAYEQPQDPYKSQQNAARVVSKREEAKRSRMRPLFLVDEDAVVFIEVRGVRARQQAERIFDVQYRFIEGDAKVAELEGIAERKVAGRTVEADPLRLEQIADAGDADIPEAYREMLG